VLQYYNMHADITQENNLTHTLSTVSEPSEMKPNLVEAAQMSVQLQKATQENY